MMQSLQVVIQKQDGCNERRRLQIPRGVKSMRSMGQVVENLRNIIQNERSHFNLSIQSSDASVEVPGLYSAPSGAV